MPGRRNLSAALVFQRVVRKLILLVVAGAASLSLVLVGTAGGASFTTNGAWSFVSAPQLHPPKLSTAKPTGNGKLAGGLFMLANTPDQALHEPTVGQGGPLIVNSRLQPVWFRPTNGLETANLREQSFEGKPVLSWWQGTVSATGVTSKGTDTVVDQHYHTVATLSGQQGWVISQHEFLIQGQDAWVTAYKSLPMNLVKYGGPAKGTLVDTAVQEYDLTSGRLLFTWDALQHVPLSESHIKPIKGVWDAYHENSISLGNGTFLVSMRNEWTAYEVNVASGQILWTISGDPKLSSFKLPSNARFQWQHDVELHPGNVLSVFDDHCCNATASGGLVSPNGSARGLVLNLNLQNHTATLAGMYGHGSNFFVPFLGNTELVPGGNVVVGWGTSHVTSLHGNVNAFTEFSKSGARLLDVLLPNPDESYRAYLQNWVGLPLTTPSGAVRSSHGKTTVYTSWNGATTVVAWRVLAGSSKTSLKTVVSHATKTGFETAIPVSGSKVYEVEGLSKSGTVLGTSKPFGSSSPTLVGGY